METFGVKIAIPEKIDEVLEADVVVVGLGVSGIACAAKAADGSVVEWGRWPYEVTEEMFVEAILEADKRGKEFLAAL